MKIRYKSNLLAGCFSILAAIVLYLIIPSQVGKEMQSVHGITSRTFPYVLCILMGVSGVGLIFQSLVSKKEETKEVELGKEVKGILYILILLAYGYGFSRSFLISTSLLGAATLGFAKCKKLSYYVIVIVAVVILYLVFTRLLHVRLP